ARSASTCDRAPHGRLRADAAKRLLRRGFRHHAAIAAVVLRRTQRTVGGLDEVFEAPALAPLGDAYGDADADRRTLRDRSLGLTDRMAQPLQRGERFLQRSLRQQHRELLAAVARDEIA